MIDIEEIKTEIVTRLKPHNLDKIILFGSYAWGNPTENSDIDLYVVTKDTFIPDNYAAKRNLVRSISRHIQDIRGKVCIDLIVHTKMMSDKFFMLKSSFSKEILEKGNILYEQ